MSAMIPAEPLTLKHGRGTNVLGCHADYSVPVCGCCIL